MPNILIIDDEAPIREVLAAALRDEGYQVETAKDGESGLSAIKKFRPDVVFLDIWMPGSMDGIEVLNRARKDFPHVEFVMISGHGTIETAVKATKLGAWDFIEKPLSMDKIFIGISNIIQFQQEKKEKETLLGYLRKNIAILGNSNSMVSLKESISQAASSDANLLLQGENGAGKNLVTQNIHYFSNRAGHPLVVVHCADLVDDLMEAELFGVEAGAMAGVSKSRRGKLELAEGGTLYFDDLADLSPFAQEKLSLAMQKKSFQRVGGKQSISFNVRMIAATQKNIQQLVEEKKFREDLFQVLATRVLRVPALKEHPEDVPVLVSHFSDAVAREGGFAKKQISDHAIEELVKHLWPGNVRELKNFIERLYILTPSDFVDVHDLRFAGLSMGTQEMSSFREARAKFEKEYLAKKINENNGNISRTAEQIGLERSYLHRKIKAFGLDTQNNGEG